MNGVNIAEYQIAWRGASVAEEQATCLLYTDEPNEGTSHKELLSELRAEILSIRLQIILPIN